MVNPWEVVVSKIKICGLRRLEDIRCVNECKPDYIGFNFYPKSKRYLPLDEAIELRKQLDSNIIPVGVFVNEKLSEVVRAVESGAVEMVQLHGNESMEYLKELRAQIGEQRMIRAIRVARSADLKGCEEIPVGMLLFDTQSPQYGGTGKTFDWNLISNIQKPFFLAGGLNEENIDAAIRGVHPFGVDVCSGVEGEDGKKDYDKVMFIVNKVKGNR